MPLYKIGGVLESEEDSEFGVFRFHVGPDSERGASEVFCPRTWVVLRAWPPAQDVALKTCSLVQDVSPVRGLNPQDGPLGHDVAHSWWRAWTPGKVMVLFFVGYVAEDRGLVRSSPGLQSQDVLPSWSSPRTYPGRLHCQDGTQPRTCLGIVAGVAQPQGVSSLAPGRSPGPSRGSCGWRPKT